ncbi:MAG: arylsulfatase A-like enzyme [Gammaproteobacteria bacterium]|jgi:arylsulfatase A-like enzyme
MLKYIKKILEIVFYVVVPNLLIICSVAEASGSRPPNILFILTDNQSASLLGTYGNPDILTPNIDRLAREGIKFNRAFAVNGLCSPTRATLMTGLMPSQHGIHSWLDDEMLDTWPKTWSAVAEFRTLPLTLKNRGFQTALIGKWHLGQPWKASIGYEHWITFTDGHTVDFWDNTVIENDLTYKVKDRHIVDFFTDKAVEYIQQYDGEKPFYLQLNYDGPYTNPPTNMGPARNRFYKDYAGKKFPSFPRVAYNENLVDQLIDSENTSPFFINKLRQGLAMHNDPETMANVASQNTLVDDGVGKVLAALKEKGLDENTLVIFSSDQGNFYGQHGLWQHTIVTKPSSMYETAMNVPLVIRHPGTIKAAQVSNILIGQYDLPVTILDYVGFGNVKLTNSPGKSFTSLLKGEQLNWQDAVFFEQEETRVIRTARYSYWKRLKTTGEHVLYDLEKDPEQNTNVYADPDYKNIIADLDDKLDKFFEKYSDKEYDLWNGGVAKGSVDRPEVYRRLYGNDWRARAEIKPEFRE